MFSAHMASGLAFRTAEPKAPAWALLVAAFLPDFLWIGLAGMGIEPADDARFFDGWSHSVVTIFAQATILALCFRSLGLRVALAIGAAVISHLLLDLPIHPQPLEIWPHAHLIASPPSWSWGQQPFALGKSRYWWCQAAVTLPLLTIYAAGRRRHHTSINVVAASVLVVCGMHLVF